jgi:outer membrane protein OmpA-like peptidoglycan-associated protein
LVEATEKLETQGQSLDEQRRRLQVICADYPDHAVCSVQSAFALAREAFCEEEEFVKHVDAVVAACHQGTCKQVDEAEIISRTDYMLLTQRLPHSLVTFRAAETKLDKKDKEQVQRFLESGQGDKGYVIVVGRASRDGNWKQNLRLAVDRAEATRKMLVDELGLDPKKVGYITYGNEKMYLTSLDAERLAGKKLSVKQANRSALVFAYPCFKDTAK